MRYAKGHKDETHAHIVQVASRLFREEGIEKIGVATVMERAGLTVGGFYSHFKSKEELVGESVASAADETLCRIFGDGEDNRKISLELILQRYLSTEHRDAPGDGCVVAALASELKLRPAATRATITEKTTAFIQRIAELLPAQAHPDTRLKTAAAIWAVMAGTLQLARIVPDAAWSAQLLQDGIGNALKLAAELASPSAQ